MKFRHLSKALALTMTAVPGIAAAASADLFDLSLDDLLQTEVTTVSRKAEKSRDAAAAVYVITREDMRRNHVTHIAEALRMVPGVHVARIDANRWAVNIREQPSYFSNRLLVQMDGRTLYSPVFSGTFWNVQDFVLEDIERIEVIRGPGSVMWGANAVNGIINIITRNAAETRGTLATANIGSEDHIAQLRHGFSLGDQWDGRVYARKRITDNMRQIEGGDNNDDWHMQQTGFRLDSRSQSDSPDSFTIQGDVYAGKESVRGLFPASGGGSLLDNSDVELRGLNLLGRWTHRQENGDRSELQAYYDRTVRLTPGVIDIRLEIWDIDFQHQSQLATGHALIWGGGFRLIQDDFGGNNLFSFSPASTSRRRWGTFIQYEFDAIPEQLSFTAGTKLEYNNYSHFEHQPSVKALWTPSDDHTFWASLARSVRTPDRSEHDISIALIDLSGSGGPFVRLLPAPDTESEKTYSLELGHRWQPGGQFSTDLTLFAKRAREGLASTQQPGTVPPGVPFLLNENNGKEDFYGAEIVVDWQPTDWWQVQAWYANLEPKFSEASTSRNQASLRSYMNLPGDFEVDSSLRYVDQFRNVPSYVAMDLRFGWHASRELDVSVSISNLTDNEHLEAPTQSFIAFQQTEIQRAFNLKLTWTPSR